MWLFINYILLISCLALSALLSGSETAFFSLSSTKLKMFATDQSLKKRRIAFLLKHPLDLLVTILIVNVAVNIGVQNIVSAMFGVDASWLLVVGVPLLLTLLFGEVLPKSLVLHHHVKMALFVANFIYFLRKLLKPLRIVITKVASFFSRLFYFYLKKSPEPSLAELKTALDESVEHGVLREDEGKLVNGLMRIDEMVINEIKRPREDIISFSIHEPIEKLIRLFVDEECSRIPVIDEYLDQLIGVITSNSFFINQEKILKGKDLKLFLVEPLFVPETVSVKIAYTEMMHAGERLAFVVDEYGKITGLMTKEDVIEIVVGQIADKRNEKPCYSRQSENAIIASGKMEISELEELFGIELTSKSNKATIGGWLTEKHEDIPQAGIEIREKTLYFKILSSSERRVKSVHIERRKEKVR